jgi:hypothetical protein
MSVVLTVSVRRSIARKSIFDQPGIGQRAVCRSVGDVQPGRYVFQTVVQPCRVLPPRHVEGIK